MRVSPKKWRYLHELMTDSYLMNHKIRILLFIFIQLCVSTITLRAQSKYVILRGTVIEEDTSLPVEQATIQLLSLPDSSFVKGVTSLREGSFSLSTKPGRFLVKVSFMGFMPYYKSLRIGTSPKVVQLGTIPLKPDAVLLEETVIVAQAPPVVMEGDTTVFNASAHRVPEGSALEELVKKLPGAEIDEDGKLTINGEAITKIIMDGEEFFINDPKVALKELTADMVDKLKAYKKKSDMARITGVDDGKEQMVLDLSIKPSMKQGWNGRLEGGYGNDNHYNGRAMANRFKDKMNISLNANASDNGISSNKNAGINFYQRNSKLKYGGSIDYRKSNRNSWSKRHTEEFLDNNSSQYSNQHSNSTGGNNALSADIRLEWQLDSLTSLIFRPSVSYTDGKTTSGNLSESLNNDLEPINRKKASNRNLTDRLSTNGSILINRKLNNKGRNVALRFYYNMGNDQTDRYALSHTEYFKYQDSVKVQNQWIDHKNINRDYRIQFTYIEPVFTNRFLELDYSYQNRNARSEKYAYNWEEAMEEYSQQPDTAQSNCYQNTYSIHRAGMSFRTIRSTYFYTVGLDVEAQKSANHTYVQDNTLDNLSRNVVNYAPNIHFRYTFSKRTTLQADYRGRSSQPSMTDLQPVKDSSDPLHIQIGNPQLKPSFTNDISTNFSTYFTKSTASLNARVSYSNTFNSVARIITYEETTGARTTQPINVNGNWRLNGTFTFSTPLRNKKFTMSTYTNTDFHNSVGFTVVDKELDAVKSTTTNLFLSERLRGNYRSDLFDLGLSAEIRYRKSGNSIKTDNERETFDYSFSADTNINLPWDIKVSSDINCRIKKGYGGQSDRTRTLLNAQISKSFLKKKKATVRLRFYDILRENESLERSVSGNSIVDRESNTSRTYFMAFVAYRFNTFGSRKR